MRAALLVIIGTISLAGGSALAQEASVRETRCWAGDVTFSAGLGIGVGDGIAICEPGSGWAAAKTDAQVAGCLLEGELSSVGAVVGIRNNDRLLLQCDTSGRWVTIDSTTEG